MRRSPQEHQANRTDYLLLLLLLQRPSVTLHMACGRRRRREYEGVEPDIATGPRLKSPHFFKIILSDTLVSGRLGIPKKFLGRYGHDLSSLVLLKVPGSSTWTIGVEKCSNSMVWLCNGWREFMQHYSIGHGHVIVFKYKGNSTFRVIIFDHSASEINYSSSSVSNLRRGFISPKREDVVEIEESEDFTPRQKMRVEPYSPCSQSSPICSSQDLTDRFGQSRSRASHSKPFSGGSTSPWPLSSFELASEFDSEHPFFKVVMRPSYIKHKAYVPRNFIMQHLLENKKMATLRHTDRSWPVKLRSYPHSIYGAIFSSGWDAFVRGTRLLVGNVCVFELVDRDNVVFQVYIFSAGKNKQSKRRVADSELIFRDHHTPPGILTTPALVGEFDSEHPFFKIVIRQCHLKKLNVPDGFIKQHIRESKGTATLRYSDRSWLVKLLKCKNRLASFSAGWSAFARETRLCIGNACVFELIDRDAVVFKVSIFSNGGKGQTHLD